MDNIIIQLINSLDFGYILSINVLTYMIIQIIDELNNERIVTMWQKRLILLFCIIVISIIYDYCGYKDYIKLVDSAILTPISWTWILKPICVKLKIDYKK